jgi:hypothetical protein
MENQNEIKCEECGRVLKPEPEMRTLHGATYMCKKCFREGEGYYENPVLPIIPLELLNEYEEITDTLVRIISAELGADSVKMLESDLLEVMDSDGSTFELKIVCKDVD